MILSSSDVGGRETANLGHTVSSEYGVLRSAKILLLRCFETSVFDEPARSKRHAGRSNCSMVLSPASSSLSLIGEAPMEILVLWLAHTYTTQVIRPANSSYVVVSKPLSSHGIQP